MPDPACAAGNTLRTLNEPNGDLRFCAKPNGEREGPFVKVHASGALRDRGSYHTDKLHGAWSTWDEKGTMREQGAYREGTLTGYWTAFHANGRKQATKEYTAAGLRRGVWSTWDENGKLVEEGEYRENEKHGFWTTWDPKTGKMLTTVEYANGQLRPKR